MTGTFLLGWAKVGRGRIDEGLEQTRQKYAAYRTLGMALNQLWWLDTLAEAHAIAGQPRTGLEVLDEAPADSMGGFLQFERPRRRGELESLMVRRGVRPLTVGKVRMAQLLLEYSTQVISADDGTSYRVRAYGEERSDAPGSAGWSSTRPT